MIDNESLGDCQLCYLDNMYGTVTL